MLETSATSVQSTDAPELRIVSATASAISAVEPRFEAYATSTFMASMVALAVPLAIRDFPRTD